MAERECPISKPGVEALGKAEAALRVLHELVICLDLPEDKKVALKSALGQHLINLIETRAEYDATSDEAIRRAAAIGALSVFSNLL